MTKPAARPPRSLVAAASRGAGLLTVLALAISGVATGVLLHFRAVAARDELLATAVAAATRDPATNRWATEGDSPVDPVEVRIVEDPYSIEGLPHSWIAYASGEHVVFGDVGDVRVMLSPLQEADDAPHFDDPTREPPHEVIAALAPRVTVARSVGPFALVYLFVAATTSVAAVIAQGRLLGRALAPLARAAAAARTVGSLGRGERLPTDGAAEIRALPEAVNVLLDRLDAAWTAQSRFTAEAAHELRTPLAVLRGEVELARRRPRDADEYRAALERVDGAASRLGLLVEALLALARVDAGQVESGRERLDASELLLGAAHQERATLAAAGCGLTLDVAEDAPVDAHRVLATAALANLFRNAARHAAGERVRASLSTAGDRMRFVVEDDGPGIPVERREEVFERFGHRVGARGAHPGGLGLGLALAREVARRHGGDCVVEASPSGGARIVWSIPMA